MLFISCGIADAMSPGTEASVFQKLTAAHQGLMEKKADDPRYLLNLQKALRAYRATPNNADSFEDLASTVSEKWDEVQRTRPGV